MEENLFTTNQQLSITSKVHWFLYLNFVLLGAGFLMSWNTMINAIDYFLLLFPSRNVEFDIALSYMIPNVFGCLIAAVFANKFSFKLRIVGGFLLFIVLLMTIPIVEFISSAEFSYFTTIVLAVIIGLTDSAVQTAIYGYASLLGVLYIQAVQVGNGVSAVLVSFLRIITKISLSQTTEGLRVSSLIYFILSSTLMLLCVVSFLLSLKTEYSRRTLALISRHQQNIHSNIGQIHKPLTSEENTEITNNEDWRKKVYSSIQYKVILKKIYRSGLVVCFVFFVTLALYPGVTSQFSSTYPQFNEGAWFLVVLFTAFNIFDMIGKLLPNWRLWTMLPKSLVYILSIGRIVYFPLFILSVNPPILRNDIVAFLIVSSFAFTNGLCGSYLMMHSADSCELYEKETALSMMTFCLAFGLALGSLCGWFLKSLVAQPHTMHYTSV